ncbi:MAG TPA: HAMP domain-containing sensor histidine kinase [Bacteroidales bacterium]|nr:HAMP domain-containing sensor histidine kinase [Bacteroidales bacterium]
MKKSRFIGLVALMMISLAGIITVQLIWINNAVKVRNDLFARAVFNSLHNSARKLEYSRQLSFYNKMMRADSLFESEVKEMNMYPFFNPDRVPLISDYLLNHGISGAAQNFSFSLNDEGGNLSIRSDIQQYELNDSVLAGDSYSLNRTVSGQASYVDPGQLRLWLEQKSRDLRRMGEKMISELYDWELNSRAGSDEVLSVLYDELRNAGINTPFEFAIIEGNKVVDGIYEDGSESKLLNSKFNVDLFNERLIPRNTRISLLFPEQKNYILSSMSLILGGSMLFSLIILITFALSIFFILRQKRVSQMKSDFINNMTHEFKTPIATISLAADTINNPRVISDSDQVKHFIGMIKKENTRMNKQVENILQISSLDKSEMEFSFSEIDMHSVIKRAIETVEIQVEGRNGNIFFYPEAGDSIVYADREHITNLMHNLLDNANKYSVGKPEITVSTLNRDGYFVVSVADKGVGMSRAVQTRIFDRFYRKTEGNVHNVKGFGLGLSYVKAIVSAHKGDIKVYSEAGTGTTFEVFLPQNENYYE